jgi:putative flavoprotein involved in K+ transport
MKRATTVIIGAGQAGLAFSKELTDRSIDHVLLERGKTANSWRTERWDSLRLLTPNWQTRLPGYRYNGPDPDGYMDIANVVGFLQGYAEAAHAPVQEETTVLSVEPHAVGYRVVTDNGDWYCNSLVLASGACNIANVPKIAAQLPASVTSVTTRQYCNPSDLPDGGVLMVGASATGVQLAREIHESGREVTLCVGEHVRVPRLYRGRDIKWWMDAVGIMDMHYKEVDDINRARRVPSLQLVGTPERSTLDLNLLRDIGVEIVGRVAGIQDDTVQFSGSLSNQCALADLKMNRLLDGIDEWVTESRREAEFEPIHRFDQTRVDERPRLGMNLEDAGIKTVFWATGYRPDYAWLNVPVFDAKGRLRHDGGVVDARGIYAMGLPFMRRRKSSFIDGVGDDAAELAAHLQSGLDRRAA